MARKTMAIMAIWVILAFSWATPGTANQPPTTNAPTMPPQAAVSPYNAPYPTNPTTTPPQPAQPLTCDQITAAAAAIGWPEKELPTLRRVSHAESRCTDTAHNPKDPHTGSYGTMQINGFWCTPNRYWPQGWLQTHGIVTTCTDLFDLHTNLTAALAIWRTTGWGAWTTY